MANPFEPLVDRCPHELVRELVERQRLRRARGLTRARVVHTHHRPACCQTVEDGAEVPGDTASRAVRECQPGAA